MGTHLVWAEVSRRTRGCQSGEIVKWLTGEIVKWLTGEIVKWLTEDGIVKWLKGDLVWAEASRRTRGRPARTPPPPPAHAQALFKRSKI